MIQQPTLFNTGSPAPSSSRRRRRSPNSRPKVSASRSRERGQRVTDSEHPNDAAARAFHEKHPEVYRLFAEMARRVIATGHSRYSPRTIWEALRWERSVGASAPGPKLNNNHVPWFARRFMREEPSCPEGFFEVRR